MGIFFERAEPSGASITGAIHDALQDTPLADAQSAHDESVRRAHELQAGAGGKHLQEKRLALTFVFLAVILAAGIVCDATAPARQLRLRRERLSLAEHRPTRQAVPDATREVVRRHYSPDCAVWFVSASARAVRASGRHAMRARPGRVRG